MTGAASGLFLKTRYFDYSFPMADLVGENATRTRKRACTRKHIWRMHHRGRYSEGGRAEDIRQCLISAAWKHKRKGPAFLRGLGIAGSSTWARTRDLRINSPSRKTASKPHG